MKQPDIHSAKRFLKPITVGVACGVIVCTVLLLLMSLLMGLRDIPQPAVSLISMLIFVVSGFAAGFVSAMLARERGLFVGMLCGLCLFLILFLASLTINGASFGIGAISKLIAVLLASGLGGIIGVNKKRKFKA